LDASNNKLTTFENCRALPYLESLNLSQNRLQTLTLPLLHSLSLLSLTKNSLSDLQFTGVSNLQRLELRGNNIASLRFVSHCPSLTELWAADNNLTDVEGIESCSRLTKLHLRKNHIKSWTLPTALLSLTDLNLRENDLDSIEGLVTAFKEDRLPALRSLNILSNPILEDKEADPIAQITAVVKLDRLNKESITSEA
jgi:hypothetical protein